MILCFIRLQGSSFADKVCPDNCYLKRRMRSGVLPMRYLGSEAVGGFLGRVVQTPYSVKTCGDHTQPQRRHPNKPLPLAKSENNGDGSCVECANCAFRCDVPFKSGKECRLSRGFAQHSNIFSVSHLELES